MVLLIILRAAYPRRRRRIVSSLKLGAKRAVTMPDNGSRNENQSIRIRVRTRGHAGGTGNFVPNRIAGVERDAWALTMSEKRSASDTEVVGTRESLITRVLPSFSWVYNEFGTSGNGE